ncbi:MAG: hypothetical protein OXG85_01675 [Chloroflexi bacterium]|nr:hypothetical protein [Chloroflexota bacterium]
MRLKRFTLLFMLLALLTAGVNAGDDPSPKAYAVAGYWHSGPSVLLADPIVQEATGLEGQDLRAALQEGSSISELIEAKDGDVESVVAALVAQAADAIQAQAAAAIDSLEAGFNEALDESHRRRFPWWRRRNPVRERFGAWGMDQTIVEATGLSLSQLKTALLRGATVSDLIEANDGDRAATVSALVEQATDGINAAADARIESYEEAVIEAFEADFSDSSRRWRKWRPRHGAFFSFWGSYDSSEAAPEDTSQQAPGESQEESTG